MKFKAGKLLQTETEIKSLEESQQELHSNDYVFVKDSEGYVFKKLESEVSPDEKIISETEYMKKSGLASYEKKFEHGGVMEHNINYYALMQM